MRVVRGRSTICRVLCVRSGANLTHTHTHTQVFKSLPSHIGFNIEIKYPVPETVDPQYSFRYFERNQMTDIILKVVYRHAHKRKIIFSCFDPDMCTM